MKTLALSIIIANWNGEDVLPDCLDSIVKSQIKNFEIIIVDNASSDNSLDIINKYRKKLPIKLIENKVNLGFASANNQGFKKSKGNFLLLLNNDTKLKANTIKKLMEKFKSDESIGAIQPKILLMDKKDYLDNAGSFWTFTGFLKHWGFMQKDRKEFSKEREIFSAKGACLLLRRDLIEKIGLFDDKFHSYFEESDLCWRIWLSGFKVVYFPSAQMYHKLGYSIQRLDTLNLNYHYYKNRIRSIIKNLSLRNLFVTLPIHLIISIGISIAFLLSGSFKSFIMIYKAMVWNLINLPDTIANRRFVQAKIRNVSDKQIFDDVGQDINWKESFNDFLRVRKDINK